MHYFITCAAGLESVLKKEIELAGYKVMSNQPTLIRFQGDLSAIAKVNLRSRVWNKLFLELGQKKISDWDGLFDLVSTIDWEKYVQGNPINVTAASRKSQLTSTPTIQSIVKKSIVKKILHGDKWQLPEDHSKEAIEIFVSLDSDVCSILLNTTGESLHKRGYKKATGEAPINEALAAGLLLLSGRKFSEPLYDFFCGSGTIAIEAALIAKNIAPGSFRKFSFQQFDRYDQSLFSNELEAAKKKIFLEKQHTIIASDIDPEMIKIAQDNAKNAGVEKYIAFAVKDVKEYLVTSNELRGAIVSNPPYGLRLNNIIDLESLYRVIAELFEKNPQLHWWIITSYKPFADMKLSGNRKRSPLYNGGEECIFFKKSLL